MVLIGFWDVFRQCSVIEGDEVFNTVVEAGSILGDSQGGLKGYCSLIGIFMPPPPPPTHCSVV